MSDLEIAQIKFKKADHLLRLGITVFIMFVVIVFVLLLVQVYQIQRQVAQNQGINAKASETRFARYTADNAKEHQKTQQYVRCVAETLIKPLADRNQVDFDSCSRP